MRTPAKSLFVTLAALPLGVFGQTISFELINHETQDSYSNLVEANSTPYSFEVHVDGNGTDMTNWGPKYKYDSGSGVVIPASGSSYVYESDYASVSALNTANGSGTYSVVFKGSSPPTGTLVGATLSLNTNPSFSFSQPSVTAANNGASWGTNDTLFLQSTGTTTVTLNTFSEWGTGNGTILNVESGTSAVESVSANNISGTSYQDADPTSFTINDSQLTPGQVYTVQIQYGEVASSPNSGTLNGTTFNELGIYYLQDSFSIDVSPEGGGSAPEPAATATVLGLSALVGVFALRCRCRPA